MNRREFWSVITGGLLGARLGWFKDPSRWWIAVDMAGPTVVKIPVTALDVESFRKMILDDDRWRTIRKDIWSGRMHFIPDDPDNDEVLVKQMPVGDDD